MNATTNALLVLAQEEPARQLDEFTVTPGVLGFVVFAVMGVAVWILLKSMSKHMNRVNFTEEEPGSGKQERPAAGSSAAAGESGPRTA
ncbi:hypothetical protein GCM10009716_14200 [Streptomyces sodiiphilus]|uniref:Uncharacterized protein n=1 Tax=Streptomyces sodiiphilus TaxID=226217 RepID=A0ABN2NWF7_9ACTN